ncbi:hypothetical protein K2224_14475 [Streptomyces sp. BHT-5-2]|uniref:FHA domain-containing protein n=1 Tax=Streptomyces sp. BHT-5-2 TaxID=2866715 RepID=UPI001C8EDFBB|nr:FHA domain-containing protein [Streptomyces sp. BHT-5-2]QZL04244.1 hypothetical protein K2224_14475 [Streptomyces sp. BHT-5-2]
MQIREFVPQVLPATMPTLSGCLPKAPPGTIVVKSPQSGLAVPPRKFTLHFGRAADDAHVPIGADDPYVTRLHGVFTCDGQQWWLRNEGRCPIQLPGTDALLRGHERAMSPGYSALLIEPCNRRSHLLEVHIVGYPAVVDDGDSEGTAATDDVYDLSA